MAIILLACAVRRRSRRPPVPAPRYPGAARAPTAPAHVHVILDVSRPTCAYDVIGTVFTTSREELAGPAAAAGGDGVYDVQCREFSDINLIASRMMDCAGRVYVCKS